MVERIVRQLAAANENLTGNVLKTTRVNFVLDQSAHLFTFWL